VERQLVLELKAVEQILPVHEAQLLTYEVGWLPNWVALEFPRRPAQGWRETDGPMINPFSVNPLWLCGSVVQGDTHGLSV
jgi:hypothetical protein